MKNIPCVFPLRPLRLGVQFSFFALLIGLSSVARAGTAHAHRQPEEVVPGVSSLDAFSDEDVIHLLIATQQPGSPAQLEHQRSDDAGKTWTSPVVLGVDRPPTIAKRGMDAQIAAAGDSVVAVWPTAGTDKMGRGPMASAVSSDGGETWRGGPNPSDSGLTIGHSFIDLAADASREGGAFHLVWLDSREGRSKGLRYARSTDGGASWSANQILDGNTCECCWNAFGLSPAGQIAVLYRRKDPRDMGVVSSNDGGRSWSTPVTVGAFGWEISACPHVGGAIAFGGRSSGEANDGGAGVGDDRDRAARIVHAAVWTARDGDTHGVYALRSNDAGATWSEPQRIGPAEASRPDLAVNARGAVTLVYDAYVGGGQGIFAVTSTDGGVNWSAPRRLSDPRAAATHPRLVRTATGVRAFWTERKPGEPAAWLSAIP